MKSMLRTLAVVGLALSLGSCTDDDISMFSKTMIWGLPGNGWDEASWQ